MSKSQIIYKDIAPGADTDVTVSTNGAQGFSVPRDLPQGGEQAPLISSELNAWTLNGTFLAADRHAPAFWSTSQSGANGAFSAKPTITLQFGQQYTSLGITLLFDEATGDYCSSVTIKWYQQSTLKASQTFAPDAVSYTCVKRVESFDKIVITLNSTSLPHRFAKLSRILIGVYRYFDRSSMLATSVINEMDLIADKLPISTLSWGLNSHEDVEYLFQLKQPVEAWNDNRLIGIFYIDKSSRSSKSQYQIECQNAFGVLDGIPFPGGVYSGKSAAALLREIVGNDFELEITAPDITLPGGAILPGTRREAMRQVLFAWGACASTDGASGIRVFSPPTSPAEIGRDRTFPGIGVTTDAIVTSVRVTAHTFQQAADGIVEINGVMYNDINNVVVINNPDVTANDKQNVIEITDATLVTPANAQAVAQRIYDHYTRRSTHESRFVWRGERLGDLVRQPNSWGGTNTGNLLKMEMKLSNTLIASGESRGI